MKYLITFFLIFTLVATDTFAQNYTEPERRKILSELKDAIDQARERIDRMQEYGKLSQAQYFDEEEVIREAQQTLELINEGNYVEPSKVENWIERLDKLGVEPGREAEGVQYDQTEIIEKRKTSLRRSEEAIKKGDTSIKKLSKRIDNAKKKLEQQKKQGNITEAEYNQKLERIQEAEQHLESLSNKIDEHKSIVELLSDRNN